MTQGLPHRKEKPKKSKYEIMEYSEVLKTQIGFGDFTIIFRKTRKETQGKEEKKST